MTQQAFVGAPAQQQTLMDVRHLSIRIPRAYGPLNVVDDVSFVVRAGEHVGLVGESGCGKTLTGLALVGLLPQGVEARGEVQWRGRDMLKLDSRHRRRLLGREIGMIYQDASASLNPAMAVRAQLRQVIDDDDVDGRARELLESVQLRDIDRILGAFPFQLSGGQRQRVLIAMALAKRPRLVIADEPTTALDETVQAQIVELLRDLQRRQSFSTILISHNIALINRVCERVMVMYGGHIVEDGPTAEVVARPHHPYSASLVSAITSLERRQRPAFTLKGTVPSPSEFPSGCRFADRCPRALDRCAVERPALATTNGGRRLACFNPVSRTA